MEDTIVLRTPVTVVRTSNMMGRVSRFFSVPFNFCIPSGDLTKVNIFYALNDKSPVRLTLGSDKAKLVRVGDFVADIPWEALCTGTNSFLLMIRSSHGKTRYLLEDFTFNIIQLPIVTFRYSFHNFVYPLEVKALPVDGLWEFGNDGITPKRVGYDCLVAFGDLSIRDYTVTAHITIHGFAVDATGYPDAMGLGVKILVPWRGHYLEGNPPFREWRCIGALSWFRYCRNMADRIRGYRLQLFRGRLKLVDNRNEPITEDVSGKKLPLGITLIFRVKVCSNKSWPSITIWQYCWYCTILMQRYMRLTF